MNIKSSSLTTFLLLSEKREEIFLGSQGGLIQCYDLENNSRVKYNLSAHSAQITVLKLSSNVTFNIKIDLLIKDTKYTNDPENIENFLASGSIDGKIKFWDVRIKNSCILNIKGHTLKVNDLDISPDMNYLVSGSDDKIVKIWDLRMNGNLLKEIKNNNQGFIECVNFHPFQSLIYYGSSDKTVRCCDIDTFQIMYQSLPEKQPIKHMQIFNNGFYTCTDSSVRKYEKLNDNIGNVLLLKDSYEINWNRIHDFKYYKDKAILATTSFGKNFICWGLSLMGENSENTETEEDKNNNELIKSFYCKDDLVKRNSSVNKFKVNQKDDLFLGKNTNIKTNINSNQNNSYMKKNNSDLKWRQVKDNISDLYDESECDNNDKSYNNNNDFILNRHNQSHSKIPFRNEYFEENDNNEYFNVDKSYFRDKIDDFEFKNKMLDEISLISNNIDDSILKHDILPDIKSNNKTFVNDDSINMSSLIKSYNKTENSFKKDYKLKSNLNFQDKYKNPKNTNNINNNGNIKSIMSYNENDGKYLNKSITNNIEHIETMNNNINVNSKNNNFDYDSDNSDFSLIEELKNIKCDDNFSTFNTSNYISNNPNRNDFLNTQGNKSLSMIQKFDINGKNNNLNENPNSNPLKLPILKQNSKIEINIINNITTTNNNVNDNRSFINVSTVMNNSLYKLFYEGDFSKSNIDSKNNNNNNNSNNIKSSKDLEIMGEIYDDTISLKKIYENRQILSQNLLKNFKESRLTTCLMNLNNTKEMTVIKEFLSMWFLRNDNKKYSYTYYQIFLLFTIVKKLWKTKYATYHEICLISLIRMSNFLFDKLILEFSNFDNHVKDSLFKDVNPSKINKELNDLIYINDNGESSRKEKVDFIISTFNYFHKSSKMQNYKETIEDKFSNVRRKLMIFR